MHFRIGWKECAAMGAMLVAAAFLLLYVREIRGEARSARSVSAEAEANEAGAEGNEAKAGANETGAEHVDRDTRTGETDENAGNRTGGTDGNADNRTGRAESDRAERGKLALTFDDGPHPFYTEQLLDGLKKRGVKATFFVTGEHAELHPEIIERMYKEGHLIGNHTYSHMQLKDSNREKFKEELIKTNRIITGITGGEVLYVRPPYGTWDKKFETELNMFPVLWTVEAVETENMGKYLQRLQGKIFLHTLTVSY